MKAYVQLLDKNLKNDIVEAMGTFSLLILDKRESLSKHIEYGFKLLERESKLKPYYGFRIVYSSKFIDSKNNHIYEYIK